MTGSGDKWPPLHTAQGSGSFPCQERLRQVGRESGIGTVGWTFASTSGSPCPISSPPAGAASHDSGCPAFLQAPGQIPSPSCSPGGQQHSGPHCRAETPQTGRAGPLLAGLWGILKVNTLTSQASRRWPCQCSRGVSCSWPGCGCPPRSCASNTSQDLGFLLLECTSGENDNLSRPVGVLT